MYQWYLLYHCSSLDCKDFYPFSQSGNVNLTNKHSIFRTIVAQILDFTILETAKKREYHGPCIPHRYLSCIKMFNVKQTKILSSIYIPPIFVLFFTPMPYDPVGTQYRTLLAHLSHKEHFHGSSSLARSLREVYENFARFLTKFSVMGPIMEHAVSAE